MSKICPQCSSVISNNSKQAANQLFCTTKCRKKHHRRNSKPRLYKARIEQREFNLLLNDEIRYVVSQCRYAGTVEILRGHNSKSLIKTMELIREKAPGHVHLCHIAPVKGDGFIGQLHHKNMFWGGDYQNNKYRNKYAGGGLYIKLTDLDDSWSIKQGATNKEILSLIKGYLGPVLSDYIRQCPVRKSKKFQVAKKIIELDSQISMDELLELNFNDLTERYSKVSHRSVYKPPKSSESKFLAYVDGLTRFIKYRDERKDTLKKLRRLMVIAYMALERVEASNTYNKYFYVKYERLVKLKYGQAMLKNPNAWSEFKDLVYKTVFETLQGVKLDVREFRREVMSYLHFPPKAWRLKVSPWQYKMMYKSSIG